MGTHSIDRHPGWKRHVRRIRRMFFIYDMLQFSVGLLVGVLVTSVLVILLEGGLNA